MMVPFDVWPPAPEGSEEARPLASDLRCAAVDAVGMRRWVGGDINNAPNLTNHFF